MSNPELEKIQALIERSSLGSREAKQARARVPLATGQAIARAAISGRYVSRRSTTGSSAGGRSTPGSTTRKS
jgi:hypothetical protein